MTTAAAPPGPTLETALETARAALAAHADPTLADAGVPALVHGALTLIEAAQRGLDVPGPPDALQRQPGQSTTTTTDETRRPELVPGAARSAEVVRPPLAVTV